MPPTSDLQVLNIVVQGGSFGVLVLLILWTARTLAPQAISTFKSQGDQFQAALDRQADRHKIDIDRRDAAFDLLVERIGQMGTALGQIADRIDRLERSGSHRPFREDTK